MISLRSVLVVGGGAIGCGLARELARRGIAATVIERAEPGAEASGAAAGLLAPQAEGLSPGPLFDLAIESRELYPGWSEELERETGIDVGWRRVGILRCDTTGMADFSRFLWQRDAGQPVEEAGPRRIAEAGGGLVAETARRALFFPRDGVVEPRKLTRALWISAERLGATVVTGVTVKRFLLSGGRCRGVETDGGAFEADGVVDAAGAWAAFDPAAPPVPVEPIRGQIVDLRPAGANLPCVVESDEVYLVPRPDGSLLAGSTEERVGFHKEVTAGAVGELIGAACRLVPSLSAARFAGAWAGLRPTTPDGLPILGASSIDGLFFAAGHYRNGILLAPITARLLADALIDGPPPALAPFSFSRFRLAPGENGKDRAGAFFG